MTRRAVKIAGGIVAGLVLISLALSSFFVVDPGERALVFNSVAGLKDATYGEGMHFKIPLIESAITMNLRVQKQQESATAASKDLQDATTQVAVNFQVDPSRLQEIYRRIGPATGGEDYMQAAVMNPIIQESVKAVTAEYTADELITKRSEVKAAIDAHIKERLATYGIQVVDVSITDFKFSDQFSQAIEAKVTAEQNALKEENNLKVVQFQAQQKIEAAKGDEQAIQIVDEQLSRSTEYVNYYMLQKWDGHLPQALGTNTIFSIASRNSTT